MLSHPNKAKILAKSIIRQSTTFGSRIQLPLTTPSTVPKEEEKCRKKSSSITMIVATKKIYNESIRKLHQTFNKSHPEENPVSLTTFFNLKPFYCYKPSEREKQSCLCINCLNPLLF